MSLLTDKIFVRALRSNQALMNQLPDGDVHNTTIAVPDEDLDNVELPYIIVSFDGMNNMNQTKDDYEGEIDSVTVSIEAAARTRPELGNLMTDVRQIVCDFFLTLSDDDPDFDLVPLDYSLSANQVQYDAIRPCFFQTLTYVCDTNK